MYKKSSVLVTKILLDFISTDSENRKEEVSLVRQFMEEKEIIQIGCKYGFVLPDRCQYNSVTGCDCGAYPRVNRG